MMSCLSSSIENGSKKVVVVVGGGVAGSLLSKSLQFDADVVLIDEKEYFEISWASLRSMVEPSFAERTLVNHTDYFTNGRLVPSTALDISPTHVTAAQGPSIPYDFLVIATGHKSDSSSLTKSQKLAHYQADYQTINSSTSILIVGGGPTGVELAAEIAVDFPAKKVTLVHRGPRLLEFVGPKASKKALDWLTSNKVEVILDQSVDLTQEGTGTYRTSGGETILADCHFVCIGKPVASSWLKETILNSSLDTHGKLMVDDYLRVRGFKNVFAIGDITDVQEIKQGYLAQNHATLTAKNLKVLMAGKEESKMGSYKTGAAIALISLGRKEAIAQFPYATISGCIPGAIKSGDLFVGKTRKLLGLKPTA